MIALHSLIQNTSSKNEGHILRKLKAVALAAGIALSLAACDPPMPASLLVELAEKNVQCESGSASLAIPSASADLGATWADAMAAACGDMSFDQVAEGESAEIEISAQTSDSCKPFARAPFSIDAGVFAFNSLDISSLNLDGKTIAGILSGQITQWDDPALVAINPDNAMPATEIILIKDSTQPAIDALGAWVKTLGADSAGSKLTPTATDFQSLLAELPEGAIALVPYSEALLAGSMLANVLNGPDAYENVVVPGLDTIASAATQWNVKSTESAVEVSLDPTQKPVPPKGSDEAPLPYQAIYPVNIALCGSDSTLTRTIARFFLRQDQQGVLATSTMVPLNENARIAGAQLIAAGLPTPAPTDSQTPAE